MSLHPNLTIKTGVPGDEQESSFMNATLQTVGNNLAVSIAVHLPDHLNDASEGQIITALTEDLKHLTDIGYVIEVQIGPDEEEDEDELA